MPRLPRRAGCTSSLYYGVFAFGGYNPRTYLKCGFDYSEKGARYRRYGCAGEAARKGAGAAHPPFPFTCGSLMLASTALIVRVATEPAIGRFVARSESEHHTDEDVAMGFWLSRYHLAGDAVTCAQNLARATPLPSPHARPRCSSRRHLRGRLVPTSSLPTAPVPPAAAACRRLPPPHQVRARQRAPRQPGLLPPEGALQATDACRGRRALRQDGQRHALRLGRGARRPAIQRDALPRDDGRRPAMTGRIPMRQFSTLRILTRVDSLLSPYRVTAARSSRVRRLARCGTRRRSQCDDTSSRSGTPAPPCQGQRCHPTAARRHRPVPRRHRRLAQARSRRRAAAPHRARGAGPQPDAQTETPDRRAPSGTLLL